MNETIVELYQKVAERLMKFLVANGCAAAQAEDIVQETFLRLVKTSDELENDPVRLAGLANAIARNYRHDHARKAENEVQQAFASLPPLLREAYTLFQVMELPVDEIARLTGASESLVKVRIFRAKEKLRPLLGNLL